jgi:hypothetical protein
LSKSCPKLSKSCPSNPKKSRKIPKNLEKSRKNPFFLLFFLWSQRPFVEKWCYHLSCKKCKKRVQKKSQKKVVFIFANFFFKIVFGHFFMSNFKIKKKVCENQIFSIFSTFLKLSFISQNSIFYIFFMEFAFSEELLVFFLIFHFLTFLKLSFIPQNSIFHIFFMEFAFLEEHFVILHLLSWFILYRMIICLFLSFFILSIQKIQTKVFNKIFFHWQCSYKLSIVIQSCPKVVHSIRKKIRKNSEKSKKFRFFYFFSYGLGYIFDKSLYTITRLKMWKKSPKKKSKKKWFSFLQTFFLKSFLDIFLCPISKLKKKFWIFHSLPLFCHFSDYCLSSFFPNL